MSLNWTNLDSRCTQESGIGIQKGFGQEVPQEAALVIGQVDGLGTKKKGRNRRTIINHVCFIDYLYLVYLAKIAEL